MSEAASKLLSALDELPPADRLALAHYLYDSVEDEENLTEEEYHAEWEAELMRRIKETEMGLGGEISGDEMRRIARDEGIAALGCPLDILSLDEDDPESVEAFIAEMDRRVGNYLSGNDPGIPAEEVHRHLREKYG